MVNLNLFFLLFFCLFFIALLTYFNRKNHVVMCIIYILFFLYPLYNYIWILDMYLGPVKQFVGNILNVPNFLLVSTVPYTVQWIKAGKLLLITTYSQEQWHRALKCQLCFVGCTLWKLKYSNEERSAYVWNGAACIRHSRMQNGLACFPFNRVSSNNWFQCKEKYLKKKNK